jgi:(1->4)-alpha-D-glucan 1-alpha-D-glucosylmutase
MLEELEPLLEAPDLQRVREMVAGLDERVKPFVMVRLLRFRQAHPNVFAGAYAPLEAEGPAREHVVAYAREADGDSLVVVVPRFPAVLDRTGRWQETEIPLGDRLANRTWVDVITGMPVPAGERLQVTALPLRWAVLHGARPGE